MGHLNTFKCSLGYGIKPVSYRKLSLKVSTEHIHTIYELLIKSNALNHNEEKFPGSWEFSSAKGRSQAKVTGPFIVS